MKNQSISPKTFCILSGISGIAGVLMIGISFNINPGPPPGASTDQLIAFGRQYYNSILWGAWLQAVGPFFITLFAFALVILAGAQNRLSGWATFFGATVLMMVSLIEITFYIAVMFDNPQVGHLISMNIISAVQHLYFIIAAPAFFMPLGIVLLGSEVLPRIFGYLAVLIGAAFFILGIVFLLNLVLPFWVTAFAGVQAFWWLAAAITLIVKAGKMSYPKN
ncbi:MAG TPA: hypothetical protein VGI43_04055 [Mucilaginibacter sp.]|jgi:hypothetical protein